MQRNSGARLLPMFIIFVIVIVVIVAIISIARSFLGGSSDPSVVSDEGEKALLNTSTTRSVRLTTRGPLVASENFRSTVIEVSPSERSMTVFTGYIGDVLDSREYSNTHQAYEQFVYALNKANMMRGNSSEEKEGDDDIRGVCATGYVYDYAVLSNDNVVKHLWTSTCDGSKGTLDASTRQLNSLFQAQIPDSSALSPFRTNSLRLNY